MHVVSSKNNLIVHNQKKKKNLSLIIWVILIKEDFYGDFRRVTKGQLRKIGQVTESNQLNGLHTKC